MKASVMAAHDRKTAALRVREQSLASLEVRNFVISLTAQQFPALCH